MVKQGKSKRTKKTKQNKRSQRNQTDGWNVQGNSKLSLPRQVTSIISDRLMTRLTYKGMQNLQIALGNVHVARRWQPSAAYDVDPLLGSTTMVGFSEMALLYGNYRVVRSHVLFRVCNTSTQPIEMILIPLNTDPGSTPTLATVDSWVNNAYGKVKLVPAIGAPPVTIKHSMSTEKIYGSKMVYFDDNFAALVNAIPVNNWYWALALRAPAAVTVAQTFVIEIDFFMDVEFYSRRNLLN